MKASTKAIRFPETLAIPGGPKAGEQIKLSTLQHILTDQRMWYYNTADGSALMALPDKPFPAMLMAERERNELLAGAVLLRALAF
jgi:hypothetical protein